MHIKVDKDYIVQLGQSRTLKLVNTPPTPPTPPTPTFGALPGKIEGWLLVYDHNITKIISLRGEILTLPSNPFRCQLSR
jgi:hypothetical protein